jgi:hypothetical protein
MNTVYVDSPDFSLFSDVQDQLNLMLSHLCCAEFANSEHGDIEQYISKQGNELLRRLLQGTLDLRATNEVQYKAVSSASGERLNHVKHHCGRAMTSVFGDVTVNRKNYSQHHKCSQSPLDAQLNLAHDKYSDGIRHRIALEALRGSFDDAVEVVERTTGGYVPKR